MQEQRYKDVIEAYLSAVPQVQRGGITVWGLRDADSWIPGFWKREDWPLMFGSDYQPKPAARGFMSGLNNDTHIVW